MVDLDIEILLKKGYWITVEPYTFKNRISWQCILYKKIKKNWVEHGGMSGDSPQKCYEWALPILTNLIK